MSDVEVKADNTKLVERELESGILAALEKIGLSAEGYAKRLCPYVTGRLRNSITHQVDSSEESVYIGTNVEYGKYVELGARGRDPKPFLRPAAEEHGSEYRKILESELRS